MAILELFAEAEKAVAKVKETQLAMESAKSSYDTASKAYAEAVNRLQEIRVQIDESMGGIVGSSNVRNF